MVIFACCALALILLWMIATVAAAVLKGRDWQPQSKKRRGVEREAGKRR